MKRSLRKRRLEAKTDYKARLEMLKSGKPRLVVRKTNRAVIVQIVVTEAAQDKTVFGTSSKILLANGWSEARAGSLKSLAAAYLTGFLVGKRVKERVPEVIVDIGMHRNIQKSRIYAAVRGARDAGLAVACSETALPDENEIARTKEMQELLSNVKEAL